jgi:low affinity Fe/Cu permease
MEKTPESSNSTIRFSETETLFRLLAEKTSKRAGSPWTFLLALLFILAWAISGFYLEFSQTWQLIINTGTSIATFFMVILIQNTQYRESRSIQLKLNELLLGTKNSRNFFLEIEEESDQELDLLKEEFKQLRKKYIEHLNRRHKKP